MERDQERVQEGQMGPHGGGFVIDGMLFGFDSGAMGWLSEESRDPTRVFEVHRSSRWRVACSWLMVAAGTPATRFLLQSGEC